MDGVAERLQLHAGATHDQLTKIVKDLGINLVICGPEAPLAAGIASAMARAQLPFFGPSAYLAQLESSKGFAKQIMAKAEIPTARYQIAKTKVQCLDLAQDFLAKHSGVVLKADGLAGGKGVFVCESKDQVDAALRQLFDGPLRGAAGEVVVEEVLEGRECSFFVMLGQSEPYPLGFAVDFKRLHEGDKGPNTGGMGCYTPVPWLPEGATNTVMETIVRPLLSVLKAAGHTYVGWLYVGLMWGADGPRVVEFNVRLGDPEAQVLVKSNDCDWLQLIVDQLGLQPPASSASGATCEMAKLNPGMAANSTGCVVGVVMASQYYPYSKPNGEKPEQKVFPKKLFPKKRVTRPGGSLAEGQAFAATVFAASVNEGPDDDTVQTGTGRILTVTATGKSFESARQMVYAKVQSLASGWHGCRYRSDIGDRLV